MPQLGEIRKGKEINGVKGTSVDRHKWIWSACELCGKERWVFLYKGKARSPKCKLCSDHINADYGRQFVKKPPWKPNQHFIQGYIFIRLREDDFFYPMAPRGYIAQHRLVVAQAKRRCLLPWEVVHHKNGIRDDNRLENLKLLPNAGNHNTQLNKVIKKLLKENGELKVRLGVYEDNNYSLR